MSSAYGTRRSGAEAVKAYANAPIADVAKAMADDKLALYYDFNQSSGNVNDRTSNANLGIRSGFGPDGDAWPSSLGVFSSPTPSVWT